MPPGEADYWRQLDLFVPARFRTPITVIGVGATGSLVTWLLAKMGCADITVYDDDVVDTHNLPNQVYGVEDVGKRKVEALRERVLRETGIALQEHAARFTRGPLRGIVFLHVDSMDTTKAIWESSIRYQLDVELLIETRMAAEGGRVYVVRPTSPREVEGYEKTLYPDAEAEESPCTRRAISPTVASLAGLAVFAMLNAVRDVPTKSETILSLSPLVMLTRDF